MEKKKLVPLEIQPGITAEAKQPTEIWDGTIMDLQECVFPKARTIRTLTTERRPVLEGEFGRLVGGFRRVRAAVHNHTRLTCMTA